MSTSKQVDITSMRPRFVINGRGRVVQALLSIVDYEALLSYVRLLEDRADHNTENDIPENRFAFYVPRKGAYAIAVWHPTEQRITVLKGSSVAGYVAGSLYPKYFNLRSKLIEDGTIKNQDGRLTFSCDHTFNNPSIAASIIAGNQRNGYDAWENSNRKSLKMLGFQKQ